MKQSGIARFHLNDVIHRRASFNFREVVKEHNGVDGHARVLGLTPLGAGFTALIIGLLASTMVFFYELKQAADSRPVREVFRDIQKKREIYKSSIYKKKIRREAELMNHNSSDKSLGSFVIKSARIVNTEFLQKLYDKTSN